LEMKDTSRLTALVKLGLRVVVCLILLADVGMPTVAADGPPFVGIAVNGTCVAGKCPPADATSPDTSVNTPFAYTLTMNSGDTFQVVGMDMHRNQNGCTAMVAFPSYSVQLIGGPATTTAQSDTVLLDVRRTLKCAQPGWSQITTAPSGEFSPDIAATSSFAYSFDGSPTLQFGPYTPPGLFNASPQTTSIPMPQGISRWHGLYTATFGAGSPIGSYIKVAGQSAPGPVFTPAPTATDEPQSAPPAASSVGRATPVAAPSAREPSNIFDWNVVLNAEADDRIQVAACSIPGPRAAQAHVCVTLTGNQPPNAGFAAVDQITYGDIVGDGGTEAVVPIDSGGSLGPVGSLIYRLDLGGPKLQAVGPGGAVFIDANQLISLSPDPAMGCSRLAWFDGMLRTTYRLVAGSLQQTSACTYVPDATDLRKPQGDCVPYTDDST
jgi:hypothetical protein